MPARLTVAVTSRALFDLEEEHRVYEEHGADRYAAVQEERELQHPEPGPAFDLVNALSRLNEGCDPLDPHVHLIVVSRNDPLTGMRLLNGVRAHGIKATKALMTGGEPVVPYLQSIQPDLFLTRSPEDAELAAKAGIPVAVLAAGSPRLPDDRQIRIAFDGDAVLYDDASERAFERSGYDGWIRHELDNDDVPMAPGPMARFALGLNGMRDIAAQVGVRIRLALVTARDGDARHRAIKTVRHWGLKLDEAHFLGGMSKADVMAAFKPHLFVDDRASHVHTVSHVAPAGLVPRLKDEPEDVALPKP